MNQLLPPLLNPHNPTSSGSKGIQSEITEKTLGIIALNTKDILEMILKPKEFLEGDLTGKRTRMELLRKLSPEKLLDIYYEYTKNIKMLPYIPHDALLILGIFESAISELQDSGIVISYSGQKCITEGRSDFIKERGRVEMSEGYRYLPDYKISFKGLIAYFKKDSLIGRRLIQSLSEKGKLDLYRVMYNEITPENEYPLKEADDYWQIIQLLLSNVKQYERNNSNGLGEGKVFYGKRGENIISTKYTIVYF